MTKDYTVFPWKDPPKGSYFVPHTSFCPPKAFLSYRASRSRGQGSPINPFSCCQANPPLSWSHQRSFQRFFGPSISRRAETAQIASYGLNSHKNVVTKVYLQRAKTHGCKRIINNDIGSSKKNFFLNESS